MAVIKYKNPKYTEGGSEPKYIVIPTLTMENDEVYVGTTEPTEGEKIWVNPSNGLTKYKNGESWEDLVPEVDLSNYLAKDNSTEYIPSGEYNPSTKGYVDDKWFDINPLILKLREYNTPIDITKFVNENYQSWDNLNTIFKTKYLYIGKNVPINVSFGPDGEFHLAIVQQNGNAHDEGKSYIYIQHFDIYKEGGTIKGYLVQQIDFGKGDGTKALMDNGQYVSTVLESNKNILRRVNIGTLTLTVGTNDSVNITNSNTLNSINPFEWFIITCNLNGSDTYLYSYNDSEGIKCFRHYTNQDNNRSVAFIITNINTVNNTCSIEYNDNNLVTNKNISNYTLTKTNTTEYTPTSDYNPATKKYVDDYNLMPKSDSQIVHTPSAGSFDKKYTVDDNDGKFSKVTILGNDDLPYDSFIILNDLSAYNIGDIVYTNIYKEDNDTIKYTVFATRDSFSISFELIECFYEGVNSVTTLVNLPATKRSIVATVTAATNLSLASNLELGQELYIRIYNNSSSAITQPIPNSGNFVSMNGTSVSIPSKSFIEMSIWCYKSGKYSIRIGEIA